MKKIKYLWDLFQAGKAVNDPAKWKKRQISVSALTVFVWAAIDVARAYGYDFAISEDVVNSVAITVITCVNLVLTVTTTEKLGLSSGDKSDS
jgi:hypothetical protein